MRVRRDDVVDGGEGERREAHREAHLAQLREGLRARHLVDQVQSDEELRLTVRELADRVGVPGLVEEIAGGGHGPPDLASGSARRDSG